MSQPTITTKGLKLLGVLEKHRLMQAAWNHKDLKVLWELNLVDKVNLVQPNGRSAISSAWSITDAGRAYLSAARRVSQ